MPLPPPRPLMSGEARVPPRSPTIGIGADRNAALKSLFDAAATSGPARQGSRPGRASRPPSTDTKARTSFSSTSLDAPTTGSFSGSAASRAR